jgi:hypothetical protein
MNDICGINRITPRWGLRLWYNYSRMAIFRMAVPHFHRAMPHANDYGLSARIGKLPITDKNMVKLGNKFDKNEYRRIT